MSESDARWALRCGGGKQWWRERGGVVWFYLRSQADGKSRVIGGIGGWSFAKPFNGCKGWLGGDGFVLMGGGVEDHNTSSKMEMMIVVERLSEKLVELSLCSPMVERMVDREEKKFLD
ncbi:hypothetical protein Tco_0086032 [Tanacetum coccineum]